MSDEESTVKSYADTIKVAKSSAIKVDITSEVTDGRISVATAEMDDTTELTALYREDIISNKKRFQEARDEEAALKVLVDRLKQSKNGNVVLDPNNPIDKKLMKSKLEDLTKEQLSWERRRNQAKKAADEARSYLDKEEKRFRTGSKVVDIPFKEGNRWYMYMTKPPVYIQTEAYMPQKECKASLYREISYKLTRKMDSFDLENMIDLYERYKDALPDEDRAARQYFERRLYDIEKVKEQDNFTVGKARQMFARMLSDWDMNKMGTLLDLEGTSHLNKAHANSSIDKKMQSIWRQIMSTLRKSAMPSLEAELTMFEFQPEAARKVDNMKALLTYLTKDLLKLKLETVFMLLRKLALSIPARSKARALALTTIARIEATLFRQEKLVAYQLILLLEPMVTNQELAFHAGLRLVLGLQAAVENNINCLEYLILPPRYQRGREELRLELELETTPAPVRLQQAYCPARNQFWWFLMKGEHVVKAGETTQLLTEVTGSYELDMALLSPKVPGLGSDGELAWVEEAEEKKVTYESRRIKVNCKKEAVEVSVDGDTLVFPTDNGGAIKRSADPDIANFAKLGWNKTNVPGPTYPEFVSSGPNEINRWRIDNPLKITASVMKEDLFPAGSMELTTDNKFLIKVETPGGTYMGELVPANHFYQQNVVRNPKPNAQMVQNLLIETRRNIVATVKGLRERLKSFHEAEYQTRIPEAGVSTVSELLNMSGTNH